MKKVLFLIHDLGHGGAEKVLVNMVNNMDRSKFDISVTALFGGGINEQFLAPHIHYRAVWKRAIPGNSHFMKLLSPKQLHRLCVREHYDIEVSYLEGPSARIVSGCADPDTKLASWIHCTMKSRSDIAKGFRSYEEACRSYRRYDQMAFVSTGVKLAFQKVCPIEKHADVLYNTNESRLILHRAGEAVEDGLFSDEEIKLVGVGKVLPNKGFDRLARIHCRLRQEGYPLHTYILGEGPQKQEIESYLEQNHASDSFTFLGYQTNPYQYVSKCDLFVCASHAEGFSTAATEALIVGTPVCTVEVSGMKEMLGENDEWGVVTPNSEEALYQGIRRLLDDPALLAHYRKKAAERGKTFSTENTVRAVEDMLERLFGEG